MGAGTRQLRQLVGGYDGAFVGVYAREYLIFPPSVSDRGAGGRIFIAQGKAKARLSLESLVAASETSSAIDAKVNDHMAV